MPVVSEISLYFPAKNVDLSSVPKVSRRIGAS
jgi:hypothetical protein